MRFFKAFALTLLLTASAGAAMSAGVKLFDFEKDSDIAAWRLIAPAQDSLVLAAGFSTAGKSSAQFISPSYKAGMCEWPAFETKPQVSDWREFDRLVIDLANPSRIKSTLYIVISDDAARQGAVKEYTAEVPGYGFRRCVINLADWPAGLDKANVQLVHCATHMPADMRLFVDSIVLLKPGEPLAEMPAGLAQEMGRWKLRALDPLVTKILQVRVGSDFGRQRLSLIEKRVREIRQEMESFSGNPEQLGKYDRELAKLDKALERIPCETKFASDYKRIGKPGGMVIGFAPSTEKILPKDMPFSVTVSKKVAVSLARNEKEGFQVAVMPESAKLRGVRISASDLKGPSGAVLAAEQVNCEVVGYVQTKSNPPYAVPYVGWWPDPILNFINSVDIEPGDLQTFWVRVRAPKRQQPGVYKGKLTVSAIGLEPAVFDMEVKVRSFTMPDCTPLPTAITFDVPEIYEYIRNVICGGEAGWNRRKYVYADFLADYYMDIDSLYRRWPPDFDVLKYRHDKGTLTAFNLGAYDADIEKNLRVYTPAYEKAKELGILDHSYIYGFDECQANMFPALEAAAASLKKAFPETLVMTTSYDHSYGQDTVVKSMDAWCPLTPSFDMKKAETARAAGKKVWWYICCGPHKPFANWFIEYPGIDIRLLMGAMTAKYRPDGFLYYSLAFWNENKPITSGPYTKWNPISWTSYHGDGSIFCAGPGGIPLATIRMENYRDGQEDFAYVRILEEIVKNYEAKAASLTDLEKQWLEQAKEAVIVPGEVVKSMTEYSLDPKLLYSWREKIADLIDSSGMADTDPWGKDFGVRGFAAVPR